jgi:hypothetical protein
MADRHQQKPYPLRIDPGLREALDASANAGGRSLNAEISQRLERSFHAAIELPVELKARLERTAEIRKRSLMSEIVDRLERSLERDYFGVVAQIESDEALRYVAAQQQVEDAREDLRQMQERLTRYDDETSIEAIKQGIELAEIEVREAELLARELRKAFLALNRERREREVIAKSFSTDAGAGAGDEGKGKEEPKS